MISKLKEYAVVVILFLLATLVMTFPLALHLSDYLAGPGQEAHEIVWQFWWFKKAVVDLKQNPFFCPYVFYPQGATLLFAETPLFYALLAIPLQSWSHNPFLAYNLLLILSFTLSGIGMYLFLSYLTRHRVAAFIGGYIFAFSPWHMAHAMGHFHLVAMEWVPVYLLFFLKAQRESRKRYVLLASLALALAATNSFYHLMVCVIFSVLYVLYFTFESRGRTNFRNRFLPGIKAEGGTIVGRKSVKDFQGSEVFYPYQKTFLVFLLAVLWLSPLIIPMAVETYKYDFYGAHVSEEFSADLLSYFIPGQVQTIGQKFLFFTKAFTGNDAENGNYPGYAVLMLSSVAVFRLWRRNKLVPFLVFAGSAFVLLSLGMHLHVGGKITKIPLPYLLAYKLVPGFAFSGVPGRFEEMTMVCLGALAAFGVKEVLTSARKKKALFISCACGVLVLEYLALPFPLSTGYGVHVRKYFPPPGRLLVAESPFYQEIAKDGEDYCVLDPANGPIYARRATEVIYLQAIHHKRIIGGILPRTTKENIDGILHLPLISEILLNQPAPGRDKLSREWRKDFARKVLDGYHIRYVIIPRSWEYPRNLIPEFYGLCKIYDDNKINVYGCCDYPTDLPKRDQGR